MSKISDGLNGADEIAPWRSHCARRSKHTKAHSSASTFSGCECSMPATEKEREGCALIATDQRSSRPSIDSYHGEADSIAPRLPTGGIGTHQ
jgi:hypothetical protein